MAFTHRPLPIPFPIAPIGAQPDRLGNWHLLGPSGEFTVVSAGGEFLHRFLLDLSGLHREARFVLHISPAGRFAAIAEEYGTRGQVFDLMNGSFAVCLERGAYQVEHCAYPLAFVAEGGRDLLIHGTDWNRLDISDPASGELLTPRISPEARHDQPDSEHYLDYFHGRLHPSPHGRWIAEYGWVWHPWGQARVWSLPRWRMENVWESEDGPSLRDDLVGCPYFWDGPMAWVDERHLAVWGLHCEEEPENEDDDPDEEIRPGIRIFDASTGEEVFRFSGPSVTSHPFIPGYRKLSGWIACDRWLYAVSPDDRSVAVWDAGEGECLHRESEFSPISHHRETGTFLSWHNGQLVLSKFQEDLTRA
jgi:hypothetical protein